MPHFAKFTFRRTDFVLAFTSNVIGLRLLPTVNPIKFFMSHKKLGEPA